MAATISEPREGGLRTRGHVRPHPPLATIITVVFRARQELQNLLENLAGFDRDGFEHIVIDGGSDDGTLEILQMWNEKIDYWLSEPDGGIYDAMNKARAVASGHFLYHLNAGDRLTYLPVKELEIAQLEDEDVVTFRVSIDGNREFHPSAGRSLRLKNTLHHQGTFYKRETFPAYDTRYKVYADFDLNQRIVRHGARVRIFDNVVALHSTGGVSNTPNVAESEHFRIIRKNHGGIYVALSWLQRKWDGVMVRLGRPSEKV